MSAAFGRDSSGESIKEGTPRVKLTELNLLQLEAVLMKCHS